MDKPMNRSTASVLATILLASALTVPAAAAETVNLGYSGTGVSGTLRRVIEREKLWQKRGLDVKPVYFNSGSVMSQAMISGDVIVTDSDVPAQLSPKMAGILD